MTTYTVQSQFSTADLAQIAALSARCEVDDQLDFPTSPEALEAVLLQPSVNPDRDLRLWRNETGQLVGFGYLDLRSDEQRLDGLLWFRVAPEHRTSRLPEEILTWGAMRLRACGQECSLPTRLMSGTGGSDHWRIALLEMHGFAPLRYFLRMERPLGMGVTIETPTLPAGFTLRTVAGAHEAEAWVELYNAAFVDHWNHHPLSVERLLHIWRSPVYQPELDLLIVAPDGIFAAFCACEIDTGADLPEGGRIGWIEVLGTRRSYRGRGFGRAALLAGLQRLQAAGVSVACLTVDADSPTGATRLYEGAGFAVTRRSIRYGQEPS